MGQAGAPFGVRGWLKIHPSHGAGQSLLEQPVWWVGAAAGPDGWQERAVAGVQQHGSALIAQLEGCTDREAALALRGAAIAVPRERLPEPAAGEYYWVDLIGLEVVNRTGEALGRVRRLMATGAHDVLVAADGSTERLIPFVEPVLETVDLDAGRIVVDWQSDY
jgi:16S rRNA processing protein RimM